MADGLKRYWFVAAVFREPHDLVSTIAELRDNGFGGNRLLILANHGAEDARIVVGGSQVGPVPVVAIHANGNDPKVDASLKLPVALRTLLEAMSVEHHDGNSGKGNCGEGQSQVYAQLRQDIAGGALVLIASVADPDQQLLGARILLRGNCECVLTHEIAA
ncbi:MAG TPA: hypothetical protein VH852_01085 [Hyphomicrobium sp.]|jgi:hypothetical protein